MAYWQTVGQRLQSLLGNFDHFELVINGVRLTPPQIAAFRRLARLPVLEPGRFWLDPGSGAMGREGSSRPMYQIYGHVDAPLAQQRSLSQRRMLFSQADLTDVWFHGSGHQ